VVPINQNLVVPKSLSHKYLPPTPTKPIPIAGSSLYQSLPLPLILSLSLSLSLCASKAAVMKNRLPFSTTFFFFYVVVYLGICTKLTLSLTPDGLSLLSLKSAVDQTSDVGLAFSNWNENDTTPCGWSGISCMNITGFSDPRVVGIAIAGRNLRGYIPSELGTLVYLRRLNLHSNNFYGSIPSQLFNATSLHSLFLYGNNLSGTIPPSICNLPRLQNLDLSNNSFSGPIPKALKNCKQLQRLILARNKFSGKIPAGIWTELENLVQLDLSANNLNGSIPEDISELGSLSGTLNLSFNHLSGRIPKSLGNLPVTLSFDLKNNNLSGEIPQTGSFTNQGPTAFLNNPLLCGFPLQKTCGNSAQGSSQSPNSAPSAENNTRKGLSPDLIILISVADAAGVALAGMVIVYIYWKRKDNSNGCSCTRKTKLGGSPTQRSDLCFFCACANGFKNEESELEEPQKGGEGGGGGELVAIDKGFTFELDELLRASAYVLGKSGFGIVYKVVLGNGIPVAVRRLGEGGDQQRYKEFVAEVQAIGRVKHPNVVRLRAYYWAPDEKLLISDFISNGNLTSVLRGESVATFQILIRFCRFGPLFACSLVFCFFFFLSACLLSWLARRPVVSGFGGLGLSRVTYDPRLTININLKWFI
jgi:Leucine-rich repeat (LRR) protein